MVENEKDGGFVGLIKDGLSYFSQFLTVGIVPPAVECADIVLKNIDGRIILMEKRILAKAYSLITLSFGGVLLILSIFFFMTEYLGRSNTLAFFSIGILVIGIGLLLKLRESDR